MKTFTLILAALLACVPASAQTTQPFPVAVFHQPVRNFDLLKDANVTVLFGPEVENSGTMTAAQLLAKDLEWLAKSDAMGFKVVLKRAWTLPKVPANCIGFSLEKDEPNGKGLAAADLKANFEQLRALDPNKPIFLSLAGDKISSANFDRDWEKRVYTDFATVCDVFTVNFYSANRNASRYPMTMTGDIVKKLATATKKPVWFWCEMNDQVVLPLPKPTEGVSRAPTDNEILTTWEYAEKQGAAGGGWFSTSQSAKYGWPASYWPTVDRDGKSIAPQLAMVKSIGGRYAFANTTPPPTTLPSTPIDVTARLDAQDARIAALTARLDAMHAASAPATQPTK
jgi:hypothetical protein